MAQPYVSGPVHVFIVLPSLVRVPSGGAAPTPPINLSGSQAGNQAGGTLSAAGAFISGAVGGVAGGGAPGATITVITRSAFYLGTTRGKPRYKHRHEWGDVMNDLGGGKIATEFLFEGTHGYMSLDFTRWNQFVMDAVCSVPNPLGTRGVNVAGDIGTAALLEGATVGVVWMYPYVLKAAMLGGGISGAMPAGRFWPLCLVEEDGEERGTEENAANLMFHMVRGYTPLGAFLTYANGVPAGVTLAAIN